MKVKYEEKFIKDLVRIYNGIAVKQGKPCLYCRNEIEEEQERSAQRHVSRVFMLDRVTCALGRMGFREKRFRTFNDTLMQVVTDYDKLALTDLKDDEKMEYTRDLLDRELKQYTGSLYVSEEERYGWE